MRLINEDDVLRIVERVTNEAVEKNQRKYLIQPRIIAEIAGLPTIQAEPVKHGRWEITENVLSYEGTFDFIGCSKCGKGFLNDLCENNGADYVDVENDFLFCPFCGSKNRMDGDSE